MSISLNSLSDQAFSRLVDAITSGELAPGERIKEAALARNMGISRGPLREALGRLEGLGLVVRQANIGARIFSLSAKSLREMFAVREALEGMACRLAATALSDDELTDLKELLERHAKSEGLRAGSDYYQGPEDEDFHLRIVRGSKNARLIRMLSEDLYYQMRVYRYRSSFLGGRATVSFEEHERIFEALCMRDGARAEDAMRQHIANAYQNLNWTDDIIGRSSAQEVMGAHV